MKTIFLISFLFFLGAAEAQPLMKLYGYSQTFTPGNIPIDRNEETGVAIKKPHTKTVYYIYLSLPAKENINVKEIRVAGQWYKLLKAATVKTPVYADQPSKKLLVGSTRNKVLELQLGDSSHTVRTKLLNKELSKAELLVYYTWKGRNYYVSLKKLTVLPPVHGL